MTRKKFDIQKESYLDAKCKLKAAFDKIIAIEEGERNPQHHKEKAAELSVAFAHYNSQAAVFRKYIYDEKKLKSFEKSDQRLAYARNRIESWFFYNKKYPDGLVWDELIPDDVFTMQTETPIHSSSIIAEGDMGTQTVSNDFLSVDSRGSMADSASVLVKDPDQSLKTVEANVSGTPVAPSPPNNMSTDSVAPENTSDALSESGTVVQNSKDAEPPSSGLQNLQLDSQKDKANKNMTSNHDLVSSVAGGSSQASSGSKASSMAKVKLQIQKELLQAQDELDQEEIQLKRKQLEQEQQQKLQQLEYEQQKKDLERKKKLIELKAKERLLEEMMEQGSNMSARSRRSNRSLLKKLGTPATANEAATNFRRMSTRPKD